MNEKRWMKLPETAAYICMSQAFVRKSIREKTIPFARVGKKALRFDRDAIDQWIAANSHDRGEGYTNKEGR